jgi:hypothetical protein
MGIEITSPHHLDGALGDDRLVDPDLVRNADREVPETKSSAARHDAGRRKPVAPSRATLYPSRVGRSIPCRKRPQRCLLNHLEGRQSKRLPA